MIGEVFTKDMIFHAGSRSIEPQSLLSDENIHWEKIYQEVLIKEHISEPVWFYTRLKISVEKKQGFYLTAHYPLLQKVDLYLIAGNGLIVHKAGGAGRPFHDRAMDNRNLAYRLDLEKDHVYDLLIRIETPNQLIFNATLHDRKSFLERENLELIWNGIYYGAVFIMLAYNFFIFMATKDRAYVYYIIFMFFSGLFYFSQHGFAYQKLWPDAPIWNMQCLYLSALGAVVMANVFTLSFLSIKTLLPGFYYFFNAISLAGVSASFLVLFGEFEIASYVVPVLGILGHGGCIYISLLAWRRGQSYAIYYFVAWLPLCTAVSYTGLSVLNLVPISRDLGLYMEAASAFEAVFLSLVLGARIRKLKSDKEKARAESLAKSDFLARMSHEIRTPMTGILGMTELLSGRLESVEGKQLNQSIHECGDELLQTINNILDLAKIEAGKMELEEIEFQGEALISGCVEEFLQHRPDARIDVACDSGLARVFHGDPTRLEQLLHALLLHFTRDDGASAIELWMGKNPMDETALSLKIGLQNSVSEETQAFGLDKLAECAGSDLFDSGELELALAEQLIELLSATGSFELKGKTVNSFTLSFGGWISKGVPDSSPSLVSTSEASIELGQNEAEIARVESKTSLQPAVKPTVFKGRILVAEDNRVNQIVIAGILAKLGVGVDLVEDGLQAVERIIEKQEKYDIVLMDCEMPGLNGYDATRRIRQFEQSRNLDPTTIWALTAHVLREQTQQCLDCGMDDVLGKPIVLSELEQKLNQWHESRTRAA